jgi:hypothetical protein
MSGLARLLARALERMDLAEVDVLGICSAPRRNRRRAQSESKPSPYSIALRRLGERRSNMRSDATHRAGAASKEDSHGRRQVQARDPLLRQLRVLLASRQFGG